MSHLHPPTDKDSKALDRGEKWVFARDAVAKQWVCEQKVEVLDKTPQKGQRSWGLLWGLRLMLFDKASRRGVPCATTRSRGLTTKGT